MTEQPPEEDRLAALRRRRAQRAADRATFAELRRHGLKARHEAKLAYLARRNQPSEPTDAPSSATCHDLRHEGDSTGSHDPHAA